MQNYGIIRQIKPLGIIPQSQRKPVIKYVGSKEKGEAIMFRIIMNSEGGFKRVDNANGLEIEVTESVLVPCEGKNVLVSAAVTYFFYPIKEEL